MSTKNEHNDKNTTEDYTFSTISVRVVKIKKQTMLGSGWDQLICKGKYWTYPYFIFV